MATSHIDSRHLDLRIVALSDVLLHEETDPERVQRLRSAVLDANVLRNPPIVAETSDGRFVVLDGATRTTAIRALGCPHILVQVVRYGIDVELEAWYHLLRPAAYTAVCERVPSSERVPLETAQIRLRERSAAGAIAHADETATLITADESQTVSSILRSIVRCYGGFGEIYRIVNDDLVRTIRDVDEVAGVVMFPAWTPKDITGAATSGDLLPAGITRHVIPGRALNVNISLDILLLDAPLTSKSSWLDRWLSSKVKARKVRFYHEAVFVFDD